MKHVVIVAGEASGDLHAAAVVNELKQTDPTLKFSGLGGVHMQNAGVSILVDLARFGITGLAGIFKHAKIIRHAFKLIKAHLITNPPDLLILVDYPGFNLRLAKFAKQKLGLRILYYISPQIWAWKANRIHTIRANVDHMAVILPFEKSLYQNANVPVSFVGHPLIKKCLLTRDALQLKQQFNLPNRARLLGILPGSRIHEIKYHMPILRESFQKLGALIPNLHVVIPIADTVEPRLIEAYLTNINVPYTLIQGHALEVIACSDVVVVASGTASLECALLKKPMCIIYKGGFVSYAMAMHFIKVKYFGLCNLLLQSMTVPELLQYDFNSNELTKLVYNLFTDATLANGMSKRLEYLIEGLSMQEADCSMPDLVVKLLQD